MTARAAALALSDTGSRPARRVRGDLRTLAGPVVDAGLMLGIVFALPVVVIAVGAPIALTLRLVLWLTGTL